MTSEESITKAVEFLGSTEGKLDILVNKYITLLASDSSSLTLVNSAGVAGPANPDFYQNKYKNFQEKADPLAYETTAVWASVFDTNTFAPFFVTRAFVDLLSKGANARAGTASVINISSVTSNFKMLVTAMSVRAQCYLVVAVLYKC